MKKNLIYFVCDEHYSELLDFNLGILKQFINSENTDICCIVNSKVLFKNNFPDYIFNIENFNRYSIWQPFERDVFAPCFFKHKIYSWVNYNNYENFLYLDVDAFVLSDINNIFKLCENNPTHILGVANTTKLNDLSKNQHYRFTKKVFNDNSLTYNAGTFAFNKNFIEYLIEYDQYIQNNIKNQYFQHDQHLFNEFFSGEKEIIIPMLSDYVFLCGPKSIDEKKIKFYLQDRSCKIVHFLGNFNNSLNRKNVSGLNYLIELCQKYIGNIYP